MTATSPTALETARRLAAASETAERALLAYREAVAESGFSAPVLVEYARFLVQHSRGGAAEEVLALALSRDGAQVDAIELYLELARELDLPADRVEWLFERLQQDIAASPVSHRAALDYAIPRRLDGVLATIGAGTDKVNRAIVRINRLYDTGTAGDAAIRSAADGLGENDLVRAHVTVALGRGEHVVAARLLASASEKAVPMNALRRAIRRARSEGYDEQLVPFLEAYLRFRSGDGWATRLLEEHRRQGVSNQSLARTGYPFPEMRPAPAFEVQRDHVLYLLHNSLPHHSAGYATRTHGLLTELNRMGWDVDGVTRLGYPYDMPGKADIPEVPRHEIVGEVDYHRLLAGREIEKKNPLYAYTDRYSRALHELAMLERPALLHSASNHWNGLTAVRTARELGIPSVYEIRGLWEVTRGSRDPAWVGSPRYRQIVRMETDAARTATRVLAITEALKEEMTSRGVDPARITVVPNGVDSTRFTPIPRDEELAERLGVSGRTVIGYVGSIVDYEGLELLLETADVLRRGREDFHVLVVGDGDQLARLQHLAQEKDLDRVVTFTGRVPHEEVERYYSLIDITPFPRLPLPVCEMVSPLKPFEAMAMGKAVVASDVAALAEIVTPGLNGLLHEKGSAESLTEQITTLLDDPVRSRELGQRSRDWVVENRDWSHLARTISRIYSELLA